MVSHLFFSYPLKGLDKVSMGLGSQHWVGVHETNLFVVFGYLTFNLNIRVQFSLGGGVSVLSLSKEDHVHDVCLLHMVQRENHHSTPFVHQ